MALLTGVFLVAGACAGTGDPSATAGPREAMPDVEMPDVDLSKHSVPLEEVYFDTFDGGVVPLADSSAEVRRSLLDVIPPIDEPRYQPGVEASWLDDDDLVLGYVGDGAYAYPIGILNYHEIVNDDIDGVPVLISYCPLCRSGIVYDRRLDGLDGTVLTFSNTSALYDSDLVMVDRQTGSYWWQVPGRAIVGTLTGAELVALPSTTTTWGVWRRAHPATVVLSRDTGFERPYERDAFSNYAERVNDGNFAFPVSEGARDGRLPAGEVVLAVEVDEVHRVYPLGSLGDAAVNDTLGPVPVVVFSLADGPSGAAYSAVVDGRLLTFELRERSFVDTQTGTTWSFGGSAEVGPLAGARLEPLASRSTFWFAQIASFPESEIYSGS